ncbi:MAG TPA: hypothetical protein VGS22_04670 [Thermoanaerobaculia bacterium]|jgi:hypothetical protein|nr:hypothetical protein [Thermoanaerobaculia bacterium]
MNAAEISDFELLHAKLQGLYDEVLTLSKKSPSDALNKFKIRIANNIMAAANAFLLAQGEALPVDGVEQLDDTDLPFNSDVVMILSQYLQCLEKLRSDNVEEYGRDWYWIVDKHRSERRASTPRKLK